MKPLTRDALIIEARAKVIWGESPESVFSYLQAKGLGDKEAGELLSALLGERVAHIRRDGFRRLATGCAFMICPVVGYFVYRAGTLSHKAFSATLVLGAWGLWKAIHGLWTVLGARKQRGEISNLSD